MRLPSAPLAGCSGSKRADIATWGNRLLLGMAATTSRKSIERAETRCRSRFTQPSLFFLFFSLSPAHPPKFIFYQLFFFFFSLSLPPSLFSFFPFLFFFCLLLFSFCWWKSDKTFGQEETRKWFFNTDVDAFSIVFRCPSSCSVYSPHCHCRRPRLPKKIKRRRKRPSFQQHRLFLSIFARTR